MRCTHIDIRLAFVAFFSIGSLIVQASNLAAQQQQCITTTEQCLQQAMDAAAKAQLAVKVLEDRLSKLENNNFAAPADAIIAFRDRCPDETWVAFGDGRFLIGSDKTRNAGNMGGLEGFQLSERNIPRHQHEMQLKKPDRDDQVIWDEGATYNNLLDGGPIHGERSPSIKSSPYGRAEPDPIPTMPPWVAVAFCRKLR